jgi:sulfur-carrier protein adenylyltransferase/sulfurtransferase
MKEITPLELKRMLDANEDVQIIDVREPYEVDICSIGADLIPMGDILENLEKVRKDVKVVVHCRSGARSGAIIQTLESQHGYTELYNLKGGILAWADEVDNSLEKY